MKFVKFINIAVVLFIITGCASQEVQPVIEKKVELKETLSFLPQQAYDERGKKIPYKGSDNPYLQLKGQVSKGSVLLFIEAKKAIKKGDLKLAKQKLLVITGNDKTLSGPWVFLGRIAQQQGELASSETYFNKAIEINRDNVSAYTGLAHTQRLLGKYNVAQNTLESALRLWKDFPEAHLNLGILYDIYLNKPLKAQQHMEAYLFLTHYKSDQVVQWFDEIKARTGKDSSFIDLGPKLSIKPEKTKPVSDVVVKTKGV